MDNEQNMKKDWQPRYGDSVFHIFDIDGLHIEQLWETSSKYCSDDGFSGEIAVSKSEDEDDRESYHTILSYASTQGVGVTYFPGSEAQMHIELPWLASIGDVKLAFAFMHALRELYTDCIILYDENREEQFELVQDNYDAMIVMRLQNIEQIIEDFKDGQHVCIGGVNHNFFVPTQEDYPEMTVEDIVIKAMNMFIEVQWNYLDCTTASKMDLTNSQTNETFTSRLLLNNGDTFVGVSQKVTLADGKGNVKNVGIGDFLSALKNNDHLEMVDPMQYVLRKMSNEEWLELYNSLEGEVCLSEGITKERVYLLRWNPIISSFTAKNYKDAVEQFPNGFKMDWSIYEWEEAREGDRYYMLRVGGDNDGIVFQGNLLSDPYEGKDWAGTTKKRHYIDINCFNLAEPNGQPIISVDELESAIPDINWEKGHSGQLLTFYQTVALDELMRDKQQ